MVIGLVPSLIEAIAQGPEGGPSATLSYAGLDPKDPTKIYVGGSGGPGSSPDFRERALQYWPETLSDTIDVGWNFKSIGGASHALAQWESNGGRTFSFDVQLSRFTMPTKTKTTFEKIKSLYQEPDANYPIDNRPYNVNVREQIRHLRAFCYPTYEDVKGVVSSLPPPIMALNIPNMGLDESGGDIVYCVMTGCDVTYTLCFRDGTPRRATVSLTLRQIVQLASGIKFYGFGDAAPAKYRTGDEESLGSNAGRQVNGLTGMSR